MRRAVSGWTGCREACRVFFVPGRMASDGNLEFSGGAAADHPAGLPGAGVPAGDGVAAGLSGLRGPRGVLGRDRRDADEDAGGVEAERDDAGAGGAEHQPGQRADADRLGGRAVYDDDQPLRGDDGPEHGDEPGGDRVAVPAECGDQWRAGGAEPGRAGAQCVVRAVFRREHAGSDGARFGRRGGCGGRHPRVHDGVRERGAERGRRDDEPDGDGGAGRLHADRDDDRRGQREHGAGRGFGDADVQHERERVGWGAGQPGAVGERERDLGRTGGRRRRR